ncbi:glycosyltransferase family 4 protein [Peribacillus asahii]|uniref:glycosyltransferase family 4 protein n=1 Tax=Peribacillus asahii TaxID=228899 RepID=UPI002079775A|nr:glycosyltransferase family 4 protein [Peribacillus asahii]USK69291.1 glycosyltransferase [Peribacillus asahii]
MKVLMICTEKLPMPPIRGGAIQTYIAGILPYLKQSHDITVLGISDPELPDEETINGVSYVRVPGKILELYKEGVVRYLESNQFDLIHIFNRPRLVLPVRNVAPKAKITLSMHNDMFNVEKIDPIEANEVLNEVSSIVTVSDYVGNVIQSLYPQAAGKVHTVYSGVDTDQFLPGSHPNMKKIRQDIRQAHGLENKTVILYAGRLSRNKGVDRLIRALPELSQKYKDLALVIVGSKWFSEDAVTDYIAYVRALAKKLSIPVVTTGFVAPSEIQNWFAAADLFVCTSIWPEPLARVHYEAMAAGLPIVTTARGGNAEVIQLRENGLVVENPEDPGQFVEKITEVLSNKAMMKRMGERGRELALSHYKWNRVASEVLIVWKQAEQTAVSVNTAETPMELTASQPKTAGTISFITDRIDKPTEKQATTKNQKTKKKRITMENQKVTEKPATVKKQKVTEKPATVKKQKVTEKPATVKKQKVTEKPATVKNKKVIEKPATVEKQKVTEKPATVENQKAMENKKQVAGLTRANLDELIIAHQMLMKARNKKNNKSNGTMNGSANRNNRNRELLNMLLREWGKNA